MACFRGKHERRHAERDRSTLPLHCWFRATGGSALRGPVNRASAVTPAFLGREYDGDLDNSTAFRSRLTAYCWDRTTHLRCGSQWLRQISVAATLGCIQLRSPRHAYRGASQSVVRIWKCNLTPETRRQLDENTAGYDARYEARWRDDYESQRQSAILFDLISKENSRDREIAGCVDRKDVGAATRIASATKPPFAQLNELFGHATLFCWNIRLARRFSLGNEAVRRCTAWRRCPTVSAAQPWSRQV